MDKSGLPASRIVRTVSSCSVCSCHSCDTPGLTSMPNASEREPRIRVSSLHPASLLERCGTGNDWLIQPIRSGMPGMGIIRASGFCCFCSTLQMLPSILNSNRSWLSSAFSCAAVLSNEFSEFICNCLARFVRDRVDCCESCEVINNHQCLVRSPKRLVSKLAN